jgi:hypothetical protein
VIKKFIYLFISGILFIVGVFLYGKLLNHKNSADIQVILKEKNIDPKAKCELIVNLKHYRMNLDFGGTTVKSYRIFLGHGRGKLVDKKRRYITTPVGKYKIVKIENNRLNYKRLFLNYPNLEDVKKAYENKFISEDEFKYYWKVGQKGKNFKFDEKIFGPKISIEGFGKLNYIFKYLPFVFNWTNGSIATNNENIDEILKYVKVGTEVKIIE